MNKNVLLDIQVTQLVINNLRLSVSFATLMNIIKLQMFAVTLIILKELAGKGRGQDHEPFINRLDDAMR